MRNIHIFYAHYNVEGKGTKPRPEWFDYENCFVNLLETIKNSDNVTVHMVMDGKIESNWVKKYQDCFISHEIVGGDMVGVTLNLYNLVKDLQCNDDDLIYILENDYLHVEGWVEQVRTLYNEFSPLSYVSLYDHNDKYFLPMYDNLVSKIWATSTLHWRSTPSTCGSYITTKKIFIEDYNDHTGVTVPIGDHHKWLFLNKHKDRFVLTPIPGLSTHCMEGLLSPTIDWKNISNK
jgi:hypothetical protein